MAETTLAEVMAELAALEDPKTREVNEKHGDDHGVNPTPPNCTSPFAPIWITEMVRRSNRGRGHDGGGGGTSSSI
ncbi:MAG TPA: hypothetical protein VFC00_10355 [Micromonosporaceae bacterium]|nr:hypothetical protein [Micromonosporaceae bacterium]